MTNPAQKSQFALVKMSTCSVSWYKIKYLGAPVHSLSRLWPVSIARESLSRWQSLNRMDFP
jgi:hypothetical protein